MDENLLSLASQVGLALTARSFTISTAESCTGGLLSHVLTGVSGSSGYFTGGVVAYSNQIKLSILGVDPDNLLKYGAVSPQIAEEMAAGIRKHFQTDIALSTTGIAGPTGGTPTKPVGLVWIGISTPDLTRSVKCQFTGDRNQIKVSTVHDALTLLLEDLEVKNI